MEDEFHKTKIKDLYDRLNLNEHYFEKKKVYSQEEKEVIGNRAKEFILHPDTEKISEAIKKEKQTYQDFREALQAVLNDEKINE